MNMNNKLEDLKSKLTILNNEHAHFKQANKEVFIKNENYIKRISSLKDEIDKINNLIQIENDIES